MDNLKRKLYIKYELKKIILKSIKNNKNLPILLNLYNNYKHSLLPKLSSITKQNNRCVISGRNKTVFKKIQYSRFVFRNELYAGNLPGLRKLSW